MKKEKSNTHRNKGVTEGVTYSVTPLDSVKGSGAILHIEEKS